MPTAADYKGLCVGAEVAAAMGSGLVAALRTRGCSDEQLEHLAPGILAHLASGAISMSWTVFRILFKRVGELYSDSELEKLGEGFASAVAKREYGLVVRLLRDPMDFVSWLREPSRHLGITCLRQELTTTASGQLRLETWMQAGYEASREYYVVRTGFLRGIAKSLGGRCATIELAIAGDRAIYKIRIPTHHRWRRRLIEFLRGGRVDVQQLEREFLDLQIMREETKSRFDELQQAADAHREHLQELVEERSQALEASREQLRHSERLASIGTLAAGIAHEINNPVGLIQLSAEYALSASAAENREALREEALHTCLREAKRAGEIVRNILRFAGGGSAERARVNLCEIVSQSKHMIASYKSGMKANITLDLGRGPLFVHGNQLELEQVLVNVIRNATESREGEVLVDIRCGAVGDLARIEITDDGCGIASRDLARLFDPFFSTRHSEGGSGLGLSVAHGIITAHEGRIWAESEPGKGTKVVLELPLLD